MNQQALLSAGLAIAALTGCATLPSPAELDAQAMAAIKASFRDEGIAKVDRVQQDLGQSACSSDKPPPEAVAEKVSAEARASVKLPSNGQYIGDWREGEKIAQSGRGMTWTDSTTAAANNGGSCYNCHQIGPAELSYGNLGPSLAGYGKNRGVSDVAAPAALPVIQYTWTKIYNSKSYNACSNMPRFGHMGLLNEQQMAHVMALLLDPQSPVNR